MNFSGHRTVDYKSCNLENRSFIYDEYSYTIRWQSWFTNVQPDSVLRAKTSIWNLKMPVSREISAAEAGKSAALPFLPDVGTPSNTTIPRNRPDINICGRPGTRRPYSFILATATFSQLNVVRGLEKRATLKGQLRDE